MGKNKASNESMGARLNGAPYNKLKKDPGVPRLPAIKDKKHSRLAHLSSPTRVTPLAGATIQSLAQTTVAVDEVDDTHEAAQSQIARDATVAAHAHQFRKVLELSDVIIQVLDARDPMGCRSRIVEDEVRKAQGDKMLVLALNKTDLVPKENVLAWLRYLRHDYPTVPLKSTPSATRQSRALSAAKGQNKGGAPHLLTLLKSYRRAHTSLTVGVVGAPNSGDVVTVGAKPGQTKDIKAVGLEKGLKVLDMPGIVWGDFLGDVDENGQRAGSLNMLGVEFLEDPIMAVESIVQRVPGETLQQIYDVPQFSDATQFLTMIALLRGRLGKGGVPDQETAARSVLNDWNSGAIPYHTEPPKFHPSSVPSIPSGEGSLPLAPSSTNEDTAMIDQGAKEPEEASDSVMTTAADIGSAQFVSKFSKPFDLEGLFSLTDKAVLDDQDGDEDEGMKIDDATGFIPDEEATDIATTTHVEPAPLRAKNSLKRAHSPTPSVASLSTIPISNAGSISSKDTRGVKQPKPKRARYNPNAPIVFDLVGTAAMVSSTKKRRVELKMRQKEALEKNSAALPSLDNTFILKTGTFFDPLSIPLPGEDEDEDL
ncbi:uncharacterized protein EI90DRAFT_317395 [Cantharellus anzutake]|uniref:uncharacterized protein n=1 Tax=Cantharellus anzutake TaxID=1750568 RepID=UPI00190743B3|nr:uncharacterized protein EI90DRAFT_317395 [Cantharellus anzutake]KAF8335331.1 hypothetical protein EI90DRAFT_317395 [Cantharellus anzutake]